MRFTVNDTLLSEARAVLHGNSTLYWILGGAGSGKTSVCRHISDSVGLPVYDMDAHIYGSFHSRYTPDRHPANHTWSTTPNSLAWLLHMSWDEFLGFNQAAAAEYLDLLAEDIGNREAGPLLIDGGLWNPGILVQAFPVHQIVCLAAPEIPGSSIWETSEDRLAMKAFVFQLPEPEKAWRSFLAFDRLITRTAIRESKENGITVVQWQQEDSAEKTAGEVAKRLGLQ